MALTKKVGFRLLKVIIRYPRCKSNWRILPVRQDNLDTHLDLITSSSNTSLLRPMACRRANLITVFYKNFQASIILLVVYADDIVITGNDMTNISSIKSFIHGQFHKKTLGMLKYFLGIEVKRRKRGFLLSQRKCVLDLLSEI